MSLITFQQLLLPWVTPCHWLDSLADVQVSGLQLDNRIVQLGDLFIAVQGHEIDARQYISDAIRAGAVAVLADNGEIEKPPVCDWHGNVPVVSISYLKSALSDIANRFYGMPSRALSIIGVTGTNGKTTVTQLIAQWLDALHQKTAVLGTTGNGFLGALENSANTTGSAINIQAALARYLDAKATHVAMEVSSHGLVQHRVKAVEFDAVVFTNLSRDHLDYHGTMEAYAEAKLCLFTHYGARHAVINADDMIGRQWLKNRPDAVAVALEPSHAQDHAGDYLYATAVTYSTQGVHIVFDSSWGAGEFSSSLIGEFNVSNLLLSLATLLSLGLDKTALLAASSTLHPVIGRMEVFTLPNAPMMIVDYAHTPDALEKALLALKQHCEGELWCVFGCGGDRDAGKRSMMAVVAEQFADRLILTDDNPRSESPEQIIKDIQKGLKQTVPVEVIHDRAAACQFAYEHAGKNDVILIAGKGHEEYQITAAGTQAYSDRDTINYLLKERK